MGGRGRAGRACGSGRETSQYRMVPSNAPDTTSSSAQGCHAAAVTSRPWPTSAASSRCVRTSYTWPRAAQHRPGERQWLCARTHDRLRPARAVCARVHLAARRAAPAGSARLAARARAAACVPGQTGAVRSNACFMHAGPALPSTGAPMCSGRRPCISRFPGRPPRRHLKETLGDVQVASVLQASAARLAGLVARRGQQPVAIRVPVRLRSGMHDSAGRTGSVSTALCSSCRRFLADTAASAVICHAFCFGPLSSAIERAHGQGKSAPA